MRIVAASTRPMIRGFSTDIGHDDHDKEKFKYSNSNIIEPGLAGKVLLNVLYPSQFLFRPA